MSLDDVRARIAQAERDAGRAPGSVTLIAVSKVQPDARVDAALAAGHRVFGENRVQEALGRWTARREAHPDLRLHLIGPLQTNKARAAVEFFDAIHVLDRPKLAAKLADAIAATGRAPELFVEVNTGEEPQKAGVLPAEADAFIEACRRDCGLPLAGLMAIPPADEPPSPHFALLAKIAARNGLSGLSMGMSADFEAAIMLGATHVRIGSAVFGERVAPHTAR
ncbi:MAG: YggS family pyridoxal phosphate-dependent enzyme [Rubrimonas sp.]|uniref:YggS family pyridoxal phosphate-dependent enzyme n=1 Tax=Rubrimonas sp. TaxID=2036015 RepID=UPI002FDEC8D4